MENLDIKSVLVTGANRGIGLEFVRQLSQIDNPPDFIFATYRSNHTLQNLKNIQEMSSKSRVFLLKMDVTVMTEIELVKKIIEDTVGDKGLTLLINNAGICDARSFPHITQENLEQHLKVNAVGPVMVTQVMLPLLEKAVAISNRTGKSVSKAAVVNITSGTGSIRDTGETFTQDLVAASYKISKAALNMSMRIIAHEVKNKGILVVSMTPGWVKTEMGQVRRGGIDLAQLESKDSIHNMIGTFSKLNETHHGHFMDRWGKERSF